MILIFDSEADSLLDTVTKMHCAVFKNYESKKVVQFVDHEQMKRSLYADWEKVGGLTLVGHNIIGYDLPLFKLLFGMDYTVQPDTLMGTPVQFIDTLVVSRETFPDRPGGHSLDTWGKRVGIDKPVVTDWSEQPIEVYLDRCTEDVGITEKVFERLMSEAGVEIWLK